MLFDINHFQFLLQPLGYKIDDTKLKRAGLDYWPYPITEATEGSLLFLHCLVSNLVYLFPTFIKLVTSN